MALDLYQSNYIKELEEEIALEGLEGITIDALWVRMLDRPSCAIRPTTDQTKAFLWKAVTAMQNMKFYLLPSPRPPIFIFRRLDCTDEMGNFVEPELPSNCYIYPHFPIEADGNLGSCPLYNQRVDITSQVRGVSVQFAQEAWGSRLVVVADQKTRLQALIEAHSNQLCEMAIKPYCFLERVGRSRHHGEVTQGKTGLQSITEDSKTLFYYKKYLCKHKLIKQQVFFLKVNKTNTTGLIIHLPRYAAEIKTKFVSDADKVAEFVRTYPERFVLYKIVTEKFSASIDIKKMILRHPKRFRSELMPYRNVYPNSDIKDWKMKNGGEKSVRIFRLIEDDEDEEEGDDDDNSGNGFLKFQYRTLSNSLVRQCFNVIETAGPRGLGLADVETILGVSHLHARGLCRYLVKKGVCGTASVDKGRQRVIHTFSKKYEKSSQNIAIQLEVEKGRLLKMLSKNADADDPPSKKMKVEEVVGSSFFKNIPKAPNVLPSQEDIDAIETQISMSDYVNQTNNFHSLIGECEETGNLITARLIRRAQLILKAVNAHKVIHDPQKLQRMINEEEELEGHKYTVDRKSVTRIVDKLVKDGHVRIMKIKLTGHGREKTLHFIVHPSVDTDHSEILSAIEQAKMKLPIITKDSIKREARQQHESRNSLSRDKEGKSSSPLKVFNLGTYDNKAGRKYGLKPKFVKKQVLHSFIFYLVYGHKGKEASREQVETLLTNKNVDLSLIDEMSPVYSTTGDWKTFLPPIPEHKDYKKGWFLVSDLLLRLPLVLFMAMVNVPYEIPGIMDYLNHPIKKYYLVKNIPQEIANTLTIHRKYIFTISELITKLAFMGLVQVGPQKLKEKDQYFVYVNRNACLFDTTPSGSGYNHISQDIQYEAMSYEFRSLEDVEQYWYDLWNFAMNTNLGCRNVMSGKPVVIESVSTKKVLVEAIIPRDVDEALSKDCGYLPGDRLGAAGLDSDLFVHLKRNWYWTSDARMETQKVLTPRKAKVKTSRKRDHSKTTNGEATSPGEFKKIKLVAPAKNKSMQSNNLEPESAETSASTSLADPESPRVKRSPLHEVQIHKKAKHRKITRFLKRKETRTGRKPYYDQIDREALRRMVKLRVDWSTLEDNVLLICKVASLYMSAESRRHVAKNFCVVREILHSSYPISQNKTSRACQRRMHYMMKNPSTAHSVYLCLEEIKQDPEITDKFGMAVEKMDRFIKSQGKGPKCCQAEYDKIYKDLVKCLLVKLKDIAATSEQVTLENASIPDTVEQFRQSYKVVVPKNLNLRYGSFSEIQNIVDIMCSVVNVVIHSSLCTAYDKTSYSYQLFFVYQQYPDKLLRSVMAKCRTMQVVSCRKRYKRWKTANSGCLPLSSSPYQLSITYINILQTRYQYNIFYECRNALQQMLKTLDLKKQALSLEGSSSSEPQNPLVEVQVTNGGECANVVELFSVNFIEIDVQFPRNLIILDPKLSEQEESYSLIMKRFKEMLSVIDSKKANNEGDEEIDEDDESKTETQTENKELPEEFNLSNKIGVANTASRLALYMMRDEPVEHLDKSLQHAHDYFVLKPCKIRVKIDEEKLTNQLLGDKKRLDVVNDIKRLALFNDETIESADIVERLEGLDMQVLEPLIYLIETKKEVGALYKDIMGRIDGRKQEIHRCLDALIENQFILKTGNVHLRFVHHKFRKPWLVKSYYIPRCKRETIAHTANTNVSWVLQLKENSDDELLLPEQPHACSKDDSDANEQEASTSKAKPSIEDNQSRDEQSVDVPPSDGATSDFSAGKGSSKSNEPVVMVLRNKKRRWASLKENKFGEFDFSAMVPIQMSMRPWFRVDGTLNRKVLDRLMGSVLGQCLCTPGMTLKTLQDRFTPALQPVHTYELVLILRRIEAVELKVLKRKTKPGLLSKRAPITEELASGYEDAEEVTVQPQLLAVSQLGCFLNERHLGRDYLDALTDSRLLSFS